MNFLHCYKSRNVRSISWPLAGKLHVTKPGEVLHFDYFYIGKGNGGLWYALLLKDEFSLHSRLVPRKAACADNASAEISR